MAYETNGRVAQKRRTREALVAAARALVADGVTPTVEAAAEAASISRTTAYRYFPNQRTLLAAAHPETVTESLLPEDAPGDVATRLDLVVDSFTRMIVDTEPQQRTMLRLSLEADPVERSQLPLRQGRAIRWIEEALTPLQPKKSTSELHRLAIAIRSATGIEVLVWLTDVAGLSRDDATTSCGGPLAPCSTRRSPTGTQTGRIRPLRDEEEPPALWRRQCNQLFLRWGFDEQFQPRRSSPCPTSDGWRTSLTRRRGDRTAQYACRHQPQ